MSNYFMKCGHVAVAVNGNGKPSCPICIGIHPGAEEIDDSPPALTGRKSICAYCKKEKDSEFGLPFFEHRPHMEKDSHYDGCRGWD